MDEIIVITTNSNGNQVITNTTVFELIHSWYHKVDIPTNYDVIVSCVLGKTQLHVVTFGELMQILTGDC